MLDLPWKGAAEISIYLQPRPEQPYSHSRITILAGFLWYTSSIAVSKTGKDGVMHFVPTSHENHAGASNSREQLQEHDQGKGRWIVICAEVSAT